MAPASFAGIRAIAVRRVPANLIFLAGTAILLTGSGEMTARPAAAAPYAGVGAAGQDAPPITYAENAILRLAKSDYMGAAQQAVHALRAAPGDANLHILAGSLLLNTGEARGARTAFLNALSCDPDDGLARYGLGLAQLAGGDRTGAMSSFARSERCGGDKTYLTLARRYAQWLDGAQVTIGDAGFPDAFVPAQRALAGLSAMRRGDMGQASEALQQAQAALPGDNIVQPGGVLMTFEAARPLAAGAPALPAATVWNGLAAPLPVQKGVTGVVEITPENASPSVAYVGYEVDGKSQGMVNVRPFAMNLDSRQFSNGWHALTIVTYDNEAVEMNRVTRRIRTFNPQSQAGALADNVARLRVALWESLTLRPDRFACTVNLGAARQKLGDMGGARKWFARACAVRPGSPQARQGLAACGGIGPGGEAMFGGLPDEKVVALTFDDGPKPGVTEPLLELLTQMQVPATFFVIGRHVMEYPDLTRQIDAAGMEIANHSYTHRNLKKISPEEVAQEVMQTQAAVQTVTGKTPRYLRPPGGNWNGQVADIVRHWGLTPCMWTVDVYGSEVIGAQQVADAVLAQVRPGSVVLMHNGKLSTLQALPTIIRELKARGYAFATVDALARRLAASREAARRAAEVYARTRHVE